LIPAPFSKIARSGKGDYPVRDTLLIYGILASSGGL
jgi:hypothetical protein